MSDPAQPSAEADPADAFFLRVLRSTFRLHRQWEAGQLSRESLDGLMAKKKWIGVIASILLAFPAIRLGVIHFSSSQTLTLGEMLDSHGGILFWLFYFPALISAFLGLVVGMKCREPKQKMTLVGPAMNGIGIALILLALF